MAFHNVSLSATQTANRVPLKKRATSVGSKSPSLRQRFCWRLFSLTKDKIDMKNFRFLPLLTCAGLCGSLAVGSIFAPSALAQPDVAPTATKAKGRPKAAGTAAKRGTKVTKRILTAIEAKSGKTLTEAQTTQLHAAQKTRAEAIEAAREQFLREAAVITGLSVEDLREIEKPGKKAAPKPATATP
jgi:hypothetical protein